ncbi:DUF3024 domain-containing protein [Paenibacillus mesotrionivorans]|uniref:DUF3024 domain-containing protein n=1 Tax=Paenibacillus mesotrionivorans TaxID=3160968 RepID=A0ACC7P3J3_9BACL
MGFDDFTKRRIGKILDAYIEAKIPDDFKADYKILYTFRGNNITLVQETPAYLPGERVELPICQFRLADNKWKVYWQDSRNRWHLVEDLEPIEDFKRQLMNIEKPEFSYMWL